MPSEVSSCQTLLSGEWTKSGGYGTGAGFHDARKAFRAAVSEAINLPTQFRNLVSEATDKDNAGLSNWGPKIVVPKAAELLDLTSEYRRIGPQTGRKARFVCAVATLVYFGEVWFTDPSPAGHEDEIRRVAERNFERSPHHSRQRQNQTGAISISTVYPSTIVQSRSCPAI